MSLPWTTKHTPKTLSEIVGNEEAIQKLLKWVNAWRRGTPQRKAVLIYGPPGVGKTITAELLAKELECDLIEMNASDWRTAGAVERVAGTASTQTTLLGNRRRVVLLDEIDGITGVEDRGGLGAVVNVIKRTHYPIILIANSPWNPRFSTLRRYCLLIEFKHPSTSQIVPYLRKICEREEIQVENGVLRFITERTKGDVRSAINDLQALAQGRKRLTQEDVDWLTGRDRQEVIFDVLRLIFTADSCTEAKTAINLADVDYEMLFEWIYENAPYQLTNPSDLSRAMDALSRADIYLNRAKSTQHWELLSYVFDMMTAGVSVSREKTPFRWVPFRFPSRIKSLSKTRKIRKIQSEIGMKIGNKCHASTATVVKEFLPYIKIIFENDIEMAAKLTKWFNFDDTMIEYLAANEKQAKAILNSARL